MGDRLVAKRNRPQNEARALCEPALHIQIAADLRASHSQDPANVAMGQFFTHSRDMAFYHGNDELGLARAVGAELNQSQLKMAEVPRGAQLVDVGDLWFPVVIIENVHIFPGIPELLRKKFESIRQRFKGVPILLKRVYVKRRESEIAERKGLLRRFGYKLA